MKPEGRYQRRSTGERGARIALAILLLAGAVLVSIAALWLHQPGFAGDPDHRLIDGGALALILLGAAATLYVAWRIARPRD